MINNLKEGQHVNTVFLMIRAEAKETGEHKPFLLATLSDRTGNIEAIKWEYDATHLVAKGPHLVSVSGVVSIYKGTKQIKLNRIESYLGSQLKITDFVKTAPISVDEMMDYLEEKYESIEDPSVKYITKFCLNKTAGGLYSYPAAKSVHHAFHAGLLYHIYGMLKIAESVIPLRKLNADYLNAGIILHDLGKVVEIDYVDLEVRENYTTEGQLLGHISIVYGWIIESVHMSKELLDEEVVLNLKHLVLSHHGKLEWGSPVIPLTPEAVALHYIDNLDASTQQVNSCVEGIEKGQWSERTKVPPFNKFYRN